MTTAAVVDFRSPSNERTFELVVEDTSLWVNAGYLAALSPYFRALCLDANFVESARGRAVFSDGDLTPQEWQQLLQFLCPSSDYRLPRIVDASNASLLAHCSKRFQLPCAKDAVEDYILSFFDAARNSSRRHDIPPPDCLFVLLVEAQQADFKASVINVLYRLLASTLPDENSLSEWTKSLPHDVGDKILLDTMNVMNFSARQAGILPHSSSSSSLSCTESCRSRRIERRLFF